MRTGFLRRARREGFILVAVLFAITVLLSAATGLAWFVRGQVRQVEREKEGLMARSVALVTARQLAAGLGYDRNDYDSPQERWFGPHMVPIEEVGVALLTFLPGDGKISLDGLFLPDGETMRLEMEEPWRRIWERLEQPRMEQLVLDYMDGDGTPRLGGAEREEFPNRVPTDLSELLACPGMTPAILYGDPEREMPGLADFVSPWGGNRINVNVAGREVLSVLDDTLTLDVSDGVVEARQEKPFESMQDLTERGGVDEAALPRLSSLLGFKSETFRAEIQVQLLNGAQRHFEVIFRKRNNVTDILLWKER